MNLFLKITITLLCSIALSLHFIHETMIQITFQFTTIARRTCYTDYAEHTSSILSRENQSPDKFSSRAKKKKNLKT